MNLLLDTHLLIWVAGSPESLSQKARLLFGSVNVSYTFSVISLWEIVIKNALGRSDFQVDASALRQNLLARGFKELQLTAEQALVVGTLPKIHKDLFDRVLLAQAIHEELVFVTADEDASKYPGRIIRV